MPEVHGGRQIDFGKPSPGQDTTGWWLIVDPLRKKRVAESSAHAGDS